MNSHRHPIDSEPAEIALLRGLSILFERRQLAHYHLKELVRIMSAEFDNLDAAINAAIDEMGKLKADKAALQAENDALKTGANSDAQLQALADKLNAAVADAEATPAA